MKNKIDIQTYPQWAKIFALVKLDKNKITKIINLFESFNRHTNNIYDIGIRNNCIWQQGIISTEITLLKVVEKPEIGNSNSRELEDNELPKWFEVFCIAIDAIVNYEYYYNKE